MTPRHAWARTFVLLTIVLDVPVLARIVRALTPEPHVETIELDGVPIEPASQAWQVAGVPRERRPSGAPPGADRPRVTRGLARAGFVVAVPDLPGLGDGELTPRTFERGAGRDSDAADRPEVRDGVALAGAQREQGLRSSQRPIQSYRNGSPSSQQWSRLPTSNGSRASRRRRGTCATVRPSVTR